MKAYEGYDKLKSSINKDMCVGCSVCAQVCPVNAIKPYEEEANMTNNIVIAGVGGQGLVLTTKLICDAAIRAGLDVKSNDVIGLSQRGGKVWGSIRIGEEVYSPNVPPKGADFLLALEPLEGLRYKRSLKDSGKFS